MGIHVEAGVGDLRLHLVDRVVDQQNTAQDAPLRLQILGRNLVHEVADRRVSVRFLRAESHAGSFRGIANREQFTMACASLS